MEVNKKNILKILEKVHLPGTKKNLIESNSLMNIQVFGDEILLDLEVANPTLQYKNKIKSACLEIFVNTFNNNVKLSINFSQKSIEEKNLIRGKQIPGVKNIIAIASGKGGVGKSTISSNVAVGLSKLGYNTGLVDADIYGPSIHIMFDLDDNTPKSINIDGKTKIKPLENYGVKLLSIGFFSKANQAVVWRGPMASKALNQLIWDAHWGDLDFLIIDLPPGTGDIHLSLVQSVPVTGSIIVSTPQDIAIADARKGVNMFQMESIQVPVLGIVENMSYFSPKELPKNKYYIFGRDGIKNLANEMNLDVLGNIPIVQSVREASDAGRPAVLQKNTEISKKFLNLASEIVEKVNYRNKKKDPTKVVKITHKKGCSN